MDVFGVQYSQIFILSGTGNSVSYLIGCEAHFMSKECYLSRCPFLMTGDVGQWPMSSGGQMEDGQRILKLPNCGIGCFWRLKLPLFWRLRKISFLLPHHLLKWCLIYHKIVLSDGQPGWISNVWALKMSQFSYSEELSTSCIITFQFPARLMFWQNPGRGRTSLSSVGTGGRAPSC